MYVAQGRGGERFCLRHMYVADGHKFGRPTNTAFYDRPLLRVILRSDRALAGDHSENLLTGRKKK